MSTQADTILANISARLRACPEWLSMQSGALQTGIWNAIVAGAKAHENVEDVLDTVVRIASDIYGLEPDAIRQPFGAKLPHKGEARAAVAEMVQKVLGVEKARDVARSLGYELTAMRSSISNRKVRYGDTPEYRAFVARVQPLIPAAA